MWLTAADTHGAWQRRGIGTRMIAAAVAYYGEVYVSTATAREESSADSRHVSQAGAALANGCVRAGILKREWIGNPYLPNLGRDDDDDREPDDDGPPNGPDYYPEPEPDPEPGRESEPEGEPEPEDPSDCY